MPLFELVNVQDYALLTENPDIPIILHDQLNLGTVLFYRVNSEKGTALELYSVNGDSADTSARVDAHTDAANT